MAEIGDVRQEDINAISLHLTQIAEAYIVNPQNVEQDLAVKSLEVRADEEPEIPEPETPQQVLEETKRVIHEERKRNPSKIISFPGVEHQLNDPVMFEDAKKKAETSKNVAWVDRIIEPKAGHVLLGEREMTYSIKRNTVDWGKEFASGSEYTVNNLATLRKLISKDIYNKFGGWGSVNELDITGGQLIINQILYVPVIEKQYLSRLPLDTADYMTGGCIAPLFDFSVLKAMKRLHTFYCDDVNFYLINIGADLGLGRRIGVSSLFDICGNLLTVTLGNETVRREDLNKPESVPIKERLKREKVSVAMSDGYKINVYAGTNGLQNYMFSNLKNYATNRGNKGIIRFCCGTVVRAGLASASGILNLGVHLIGGAVKQGVRMLRDGTTPVSGDEV